MIVWGGGGSHLYLNHRREILRGCIESDTDSYGDDNSKPEPDRDGHVYTNSGTEIYTNT